MAGQLFGHYRVVEKIGAGGMGDVFRARDERLGRDVALKLISPASGDNPDHLRRFEQEARAAAALNHPNIVAIYDVGFEGSTPYLVSELLEGVTLRQRLNDGAISVRHAADYALQVASGLIAAHDRGIVHRDLKPENLFLTTDGRIKILDFGVAKLQFNAEGNRPVEQLTTITKSGAIIGTVAYMSPEQLRAKPVDHRSDVFSFGAILYEMLTAHRAFSGETEVDTMTAVLREEPPEANLEKMAIPSGYWDIIRHCLEKEPDNRFQSVKDLAFALQSVSGSAARRAATAKTRRKASRFLPWAVAAVSALTAVYFFVELHRYLVNLPTYTQLTSEAGTVYQSRFMPDGQSIVYSPAWDNGPVELFSTVGNSGLPQPLHLTNASLLAVTSDREVAIVEGGTHSGQLETQGGVLALAPLGGGSPRETLSDVRWADSKPNGKLAVVHYVKGWSRLEFPIGTVLYQTQGWISHIRVSPQGDRIAFIDHPAEWDVRGAICVTDLSGHVQTLTNQWESAQGVAWRPDGKEIWFTATQKGEALNLLAVDLAGKIRTVLNSPVGIILQDISSDGRVLVTTLNSRRLSLALSVQGVEPDKELSWHDWNVAKDISRDGQFVLFEDASQSAGPGYAVVLRRVDGSLPIKLGEGSAGGLSPDGKWAISISTGEPQQITLLPIGPGESRPVDLGGLEHIQNGIARFLSNGEGIVVNGNEPGQGERCYVLALAGGKAKAVTPEGARCGPSSPDGRFIVGMGRNGDLARYPVQGGPPQPIPLKRPTFQPSRWSNDGEALYGYYASEFPRKVYRVEIATGKETVIRELKPSVPAGVVTVAPIVVSGDGTRIAYCYNQSLSTLYLVSGLH
jgi:eukaryotic-like serine/threonine-protein kinase